MQPVLIVDDNADIRLLIRLCLGSGYEVIEAGDGLSALRAAREHRPRVVVLDIMMPGEMDGLDVLDEIERDENLAQTRVIVLSARRRSSDYRESLERGASAYLNKPFSPTQLANRVRELWQ